MGSSRPLKKVNNEVEACERSAIVEEIAASKKGEGDRWNFNKVIMTCSLLCFSELYLWIFELYWRLCYSFPFWVLIKTSSNNLRASSVKAYMLSNRSLEPVIIVFVIGGPFSRAIARQVKPLKEENEIKKIDSPNLFFLWTWLGIWPIQLTEANYGLEILAQLRLLRQCNKLNADVPAPLQPI